MAKSQIAIAIPNLSSKKLSLDELRKRWNEGWDCVFAFIRPVTNDDIEKEVFIRGESHTVMEAILRQISHYGYHVGQIVYVGKQIKGSEWKTLSIPRGKSEDFNQIGINKK